MNKKLYNYFSKLSKEYRSNQVRVPWSLIRKYELEQIRKHIIGLGLQSRRSVLELGAGTGGLTSMLLEAFDWNILATDFNEKMLSSIPPDSRLSKAVLNISSEPKILDYDLVICFGAFEYLSAPVKAIKKYVLAKKKETVLVLILPTNNFGGVFYRFFHPAGSEHICLANLEDIIELKSLAVTVTYSGIYPFNKIVVIQ